MSQRGNAIGRAQCLINGASATVVIAHHKNRVAINGSAYVYVYPDQNPEFASVLDGEILFEAISDSPKSDGDPFLQSCLNFISVPSSIGTSIEKQQEQLWKNINVTGIVKIGNAYRKEYQADDPVAIISGSCPVRNTGPFVVRTGNLIFAMPPTRGHDQSPTDEDYAHSSRRVLATIPHTKLDEFKIVSPNSSIESLAYVLKISHDYLESHELQNENENKIATVQDTRNKLMNCLHNYKLMSMYSGLTPIGIAMSSANPGGMFDAIISPGILNMFSKPQGILKRSFLMDEIEFQNQVFAKLGEYSKDGVGGNTKKQKTILDENDNESDNEHVYQELI
jgi:hypothetical protein